MPTQTPDHYQPIHQALRAALADTLLALGALDLDDAGMCRSTLATAQGRLRLMAQHLAHEETFIHPLLEAAAAGSSQRANADHAEHRAGIEALQAEIHQLADQPSPAAALRLYRHWALFMAEHLVHMHHEETALNAVLWSAYSGAELDAVHQRLVASIPPADTAAAWALMLPALNPQQRTGLLATLRTDAPPAVFQGALGLAQQVLDHRAWAQLARSLGLAPVPGLVAA